MKMRSLTVLAFTLLAAFRASGQTEWRIADSETTGDFREIIYSGAGFYATNGNIHFSADGIKWYQIHSTSDPILSLSPCHGGVIMISSKGFTAQGNPRIAFPSAYAAWNADSAYLNGVVVITGLVDPGGTAVIGRYLDSTSRVTEIKGPWSVSTTWVISTGSEFLMWGGGAIYASPDGLSWAVRSRTSIMDKPFLHNGILYSSFYTSKDDGKTWDNSPEFKIPDAFGNGVIVRRENTGEVSLSENGLEWRRQETGTTSVLTGMAFGNGRFVAVGLGGRIITSMADNPSAEVIAPDVEIKPAVTLKWKTTQGLYYQIQRSNNMKQWTTVGAPMLGTGMEMERTLPATADRGQFRVTVR